MMQRITDSYIHELILYLEICFFRTQNDCFYSYLKQTTLKICGRRRLYVVIRAEDVKYVTHVVQRLQDYRITHPGAYFRNCILSYIELFSVLLFETKILNILYPTTDFRRESAADVTYVIDVVYHRQY